MSEYIAVTGDITWIGKRSFDFKPSMLYDSINITYGQLHPQDVPSAEVNDVILRLSAHIVVKYGLVQKEPLPVNPIPDRQFETVNRGLTLDQLQEKQMVDPDGEVEEIRTAEEIDEDNLDTEAADRRND